jgi:hypothetical protein
MTNQAVEEQSNLPEECKSDLYVNIIEVTRYTHRPL